MSRESDHRLMNGLQMVASLLSLQSREAPNAKDSRSTEDRCKSRRHNSQRT
ncbi:histidine kinase dimerization/phosphoacceptor domain -containing protein [Bradyrhizobium japonicum]|uniref:histidine kinase dimerization/phosphoacceptor domain -containing protein n=2 Tax=Nitrobacteraceae TaxID=41294 RepID=UPI003BF4F38F